MIGWMNGSPGKEEAEGGDDVNEWSGGTAVVPGVTDESPAPK